MAATNNKIRIGYHIKIKSSTDPEIKHKNLLEAIKYAHEKENVNVIQIFSHVPNTGVPSKLDVAEINKYTKENDIKLFIHCSYVSISIFNNKRLDRLNSELSSARDLNSSGIVIHIARNSPDKIVKLFEENKKDWSSYNVPILIENSAYAESKSKKDKEDVDIFNYTNVDNLNELYDKLASNFDKKYVSGCLDTAHLFAAGVPLNDWDKIKLTNISLIHFNGCESAFGSGKDKHAIPFIDDDVIPKNTLINFVKRCIKLPLIIEANRGQNVDLIKCFNTIKNL